MINIIVIPLILLLVELFRRARRYVERKQKIDKILKNIEGNNTLRIENKTEFYSEINTKLKRKRFPWWTKIIAYLISHSLMIISTTFVIIKGIDFGDQTCGKWLTSLIFAFISSAFLTQPLQVKYSTFINQFLILIHKINLLKAFLTTVVFSCIFRKSDDEEIEDEDYILKRCKSIQTDEDWLHIEPVRME